MPYSSETVANTSIKNRVTAISGIKMYNDQGIKNTLSVKTIINGTFIQHTITVAESNLLYTLDLTTIIFYTDTPPANQA
jgi:hypothetical protein